MTKTRVQHMGILYPCSLASRIRTANSGKVRKFLNLPHYLPYVFLPSFTYLLTQLLLGLIRNTIGIATYCCLKIQCLNFLVICAKSCIDQMKQSLSQPDLEHWQKLNTNSQKQTWRLVLYHVIKLNQKSIHCLIFYGCSKQCNYRTKTRCSGSFVNVVLKNLA